ncbi:hypothetical protein E2562_013368 [Oryza meyeriana var. granulata]|uniref:Uncharacterized protein n=1 Tax=Oryza meyeriana var. granulata TaxID=110450 RepID=A0A6G1CG40_9ORYZ|nr:hypothetical protein E2562_013368 [Oryza meyeriana var. granulata]
MALLCPSHAPCSVPSPGSQPTRPLVAACLRQATPLHNEHPHRLYLSVHSLSRRKIVGTAAINAPPRTRTRARTGSALPLTGRWYLDPCEPLVAVKAF